MATLDRDPRTGNWLVRFRYNGQQYQRSCRTSKKPVANRILASVDETVELLKTGRLSVPEKADIGQWVLSGGKAAETNGTKAHSKSRFGPVCDSYFDDQKKKADSTKSQEKTHIGHLKRIIRQRTLMSAIDLQTLKNYALKRSREKYRDKPITDKTIRKELTTFRQIWIWAQRNSQTDRSCPLLGPDGRWEVQFEKPTESIKFQTWAQIERRIKRGRMTEGETAELWNYLFLDETQVGELLNHVQDNAPYPFQFPMFAFAAYTGARRSEICRSEVDDIDFEQNQILIRERKRRKNLAATYRHVPLHPKLRDVMHKWLVEHPGGHKTFVLPLWMPGTAARSEHLPLTINKATKHFKGALKSTKWNVVKGFHVLRHSFGSNLARSGKVSSEVVGKWMGHTTDEMRELYQHLFPQDGVEQISVLS